MEWQRKSASGTGIRASLPRSPFGGSAVRFLQSTYPVVTDPNGGGSASHHAATKRLKCRWQQVGGSVCYYGMWVGVCLGVQVSHMGVCECARRVKRSVIRPPPSSIRPSGVRQPPGSATSTPFAQLRLHGATGGQLSARALGLIGGHRDGGQSNEKQVIRAVMLEDSPVTDQDMRLRLVNASPDRR